MNRFPGLLRGIPRRLARGLCMGLVLGFCAPASLAQTILCIGDSITEGKNLHGGTYAWPKLLQERVPKGAVVHNLGEGGATLLAGTDRPYLQTQEWLQNKVGAAQVAIVILGTNDTILNERRKPWEQVDHLEADLQALVEALRTRHEVSTIFLCSPPPMFPDKPGLKPERAADLRVRLPRRQQLCEAYRRFAQQHTGVHYVDLTRVLTAREVTDGVHLTVYGSEALANHLAQVLRIPVLDGPSVTVASLEAQGYVVSGSDYHGFERLDIMLFDRPMPPGTPYPMDVKVVRPHREAKGRPWIWRARFFGHEPAIDLELLDRGFHLAYCEVIGLYGSPYAVENWNTAYQLLHQAFGLHRKPILHGLSRGALPVLNFAAAYPDRYSALVLDNPVCDPRSWPGGNTGQRSDEDWERLKLRYGLNEEQALQKEWISPELVDAIAQSQKPVHLILGSADQVVPPAENGLVLMERLLSKGAPVTAWHKPGAGHHPHGLHPPAPLVRALLRQTGIDPQFPTTLPVPSVEYRGPAAGWGKGGTWSNEVAAMRALTEERPDVQVVFLGDSITQNLKRAGSRLSQPGGDRPLDRFESAISLGLSGDRTEHVLYRIQHGALPKIAPRWIVVQIGVNNINTARHTGEEVAEGVAAIVASLRFHQPQARILLCGPFPTGSEPGDPKRAAIETVHARSRQLAEAEGIDHLDLRPLFLDENGRPNEHMRDDAIHIHGSGQALWLQAVADHMRTAEAD